MAFGKAVGSYINRVDDAIIGDERRLVVGFLFGWIESRVLFTSDILIHCECSHAPGRVSRHGVATETYARTCRTILVGQGAPTQIVR